jgi:hypothetical protein
VITRLCGAQGLAYGEQIGMQRRARLGQHHAPRGAMDQPHAQSLLQPRQSLRQAGRGQAQARAAAEMLPAATMARKRS